MTKHPWLIRTFMACFIIVTVMILILQGYELKAHAPANDQIIDATRIKSQPASDVLGVYMSWPIPSEYVSKPLIGSRDQDRIGELLKWLDEVKPSDGQGLTSPMMGRSMATID